MPPYGERLGGGAVRPLCRGVASSEAEMTYPLEGRFATLERGGDALRGRGSQGEPSSEAEMSDPLEGGFATLERGGGAGRSRGVSTGTLEQGGDCPAGSRGMRMSRTLGFFESFPFSLDRKEAVGLHGPSCLNRCLRFKTVLVP